MNAENGRGRANGNVRNGYVHNKMELLNVTYTRPDPRVSSYSSSTTLRSSMEQRQNSTPMELPVPRFVTDKNSVKP